MYVSRILDCRGGARQEISKREEVLGLDLLGCNGARLEVWNKKKLERIKKDWKT